MEPVAEKALPVLVADLADEGARDFLVGVAQAGEVALGVVSTAILGERLRLASSPQTSDEAEIAVNLARSLLAIAPDRPAAELAVAKSSEQWPAELRARAR